MKYASRLLILFIFAGILSCETGAVSVEFEEINAAQLATFKVKNASEKDIQNLVTEISYFGREKLLQKDTVSHTGKDAGQPFLKAGEETYFTRQAPELTVSAEARVLEQY